MTRFEKEISRICELLAKAMAYSHNEWDAIARIDLSSLTCPDGLVYYASCGFLRTTTHEVDLDQKKQLDRIV